MEILLSCRELTKSYGLRTLFKGITLGLFEGERTGLIGPNGSGKSTLLRILAGIETQDAGELVSRRSLRLGYVAQEDALDREQTVEESLVSAIEGHLDEHERQVQAAIMLGRIGFDKGDQKVGTLSGGWTKRLAIARQLMREPDLLLLDEPTNHLDVEGITWLEELLKDAPFACLLVSHDRRFLENVTNRVIELSRAYPDGFLSSTGAYSDFLRTRESFLEAQASRERSLAGRVRREIEWLQRGAKARTTKAKGRIDEAGRMMEELSELKVRNAQQLAAQIDFSGTDRKTRKMLQAKGVAKSLGGRPLFSGVNFTLGPGDKLGLLGPNGSGKTTLLRVMFGELAPDAGEMWRADGLRVLTFSQNREQLEKSETLRSTLAGQSDVVSYRGGTMHITAYARRFLFTTDQLNMPVGEMSGGEQARILIARLMLQPADVLILDEPTNDLDIPTLDVLEESLAEFPGVLVLVTHDRYLLDRLSTELLALDGDGHAHAYAELAQWERAREHAAARAAAAAAAKKPAPAKRRRTPTVVKGLNWGEEEELAEMETRIAAGEAEVEAWQQKVADPAAASDHVRLRELCDKLHDAQAAVEALYARWAELEAKRDA
jgi:ABC transport system ATP-binding/permease protein